ncbi:MAG: DUF58 domain-containing protein [Planctomycetaceae bacterium]|nr:DUF58 domain-containing protein [Planctomycetaceae bacterium]
MHGYIENLDTLDARQFVVAVRKLADSLRFGTDRSAYLGSGVEYVQSRPYQEGDPIRSIDWRTTARTGKPHIKEFETPRSLPVFLLIDTSASMMVSSWKRSKYETALHLAGGLALACLDRVSPVGVLGVGARDLRVSPTLARDQVMQWLLQLRRHRFDEHTELGRKLTELLPTLPERTLLMIFSDMHDPQALRPILQSTERHDVVVIQLRDPLEEGHQASGIVRAVEAETGRSFVTRIRASPVDNEALTRDLKRGGVDHLQIRTDRPFVAQVRSFFSSRGILNRGAR